MTIERRGVDRGGSEMALRTTQVPSPHTLFCSRQILRMSALHYASVLLEALKRHTLRGKCKELDRYLSIVEELLQAEVWPLKPHSACMAPYSCMSTW